MWHMCIGTVMEWSADVPTFCLVVDTRIVSHFNLCCLAVKSGTVQLSACRAEYLCFVRRTCYSVRSLYVSVLLDPIFMGCQSNLYVRRLEPPLSLSCTSDQFLGRQLKCHLERSFIMLMAWQKGINLLRFLCFRKEVSFLAAAFLIAQIILHLALRCSSHLMTTRQAQDEPET